MTKFLENDEPVFRVVDDEPVAQPAAEDGEDDTDGRQSNEDLAEEARK